MFLQRIRQAWGENCMADKVFLGLTVAGIIGIGVWGMLYSLTGLSTIVGMSAVACIFSGMKSIYDSYQKPSSRVLRTRREISQYRTQQYHLFLQRRAEALLRVLHLDPRILEEVPSLRLGLFLEGYLPDEGEEVVTRERARCEAAVRGRVRTGRGYFRNGLLRHLQEILYAQGIFYNLKALHQWLERFLMPETRLEALNWLPLAQREIVSAQGREQLLEQAGFRRSPGRLSPLEERKAHSLWEQKEKDEAERAFECSILYSLPWEPVRAGDGNHLYERRVLLEEFLKGEQKLPFRDGEFEEERPPYLLEVEDRITENAFRSVAQQIQRTEMREELLLDPEEDQVREKRGYAEEVIELRSRVIALEVKTDQIAQKMDSTHQKIILMGQEFQRERERCQRQRQELQQHIEQLSWAAMLQAAEKRRFNKRVVFLPQYQTCMQDSPVQTATILATQKNESPSLRAEKSQRILG